MELEHSRIQFITEIKEKVRAAQYEALRAVNIQLIDLYWELGKAISEKQAAGWGKAIVPTLSEELQNEFPKILRLNVENNYRYSGPNSQTDQKKILSLRPSLPSLAILQKVWFYTIVEAMA